MLLDSMVWRVITNVSGRRRLEKFGSNHHFPHRKNISHFQFRKKNWDKKYPALKFHRTKIISKAYFFNTSLKVLVSQETKYILFWNDFDAYILICSFISKALDHLLKVIFKIFLWKKQIWVRKYSSLQNFFINFEKFYNFCEFHIAQTQEKQ